MSLSCIISETKRDIGLKSWLFHTPPAFNAPFGGGSLSEYSRKVQSGKTRMLWLPDGTKSLICSANSTQCQRVTNGQTDGQTSCHGIVRAMHSIARGKNCQNQFMHVDCRRYRKWTAFLRQSVCRYTAEQARRMSGVDESESRRKWIRAVSI